MKSSEKKAVIHVSSDIVKIISCRVVLWEAVKRYIVIGDRDGVPTQEMLTALTTSNLNLVANVEDTYLQSHIDYKKLVNMYSSLYNEPADFIIGAGSVEVAEGIATEAKKRGVKTYHICEPEIKDRCDPDAYDEYVGMMELVLDVEGIHNELKAIRGES